MSDERRRTPQRKETPTATDVAALAGVSAATVSYVLSGRRRTNPKFSGVSAETKQRVLAAVEQLGYVPNHTARSLRRGKTERICLVLHSLNTPFLNVLASDLQRIGEEHGFSLILTLCGSAEREREAVTQLQRGLADGAVFARTKLTDADLAPLARVGLPVVAYSNEVAANGIDVVRTDEAQVGYEAVTYLLDRGHRRIAYLGSFYRDPEPGKYDDFVAQERFMSYLSALAEHHPDGERAIDPDLIVDGAWSRRIAYERTTSLLKLNDPPTAIVSAADMAAVSALAAIADAGLSVPGDVAVIGTGNIPETETTRPSLTTIGPTPLDFSVVGELLFSRLGHEGPLDGRMHTIPWSLIVRDST